MIDYSDYSADALLEAAAAVSEDVDGRQWAQGEIALEVRKRATYGEMDMKRYALAARRAEKTLYGYAQTVECYQSAGYSAWAEFRQRFACGFTVARDVAVKFGDPVAAVSYLEERAALDTEDKWRVETVRASLRGIFDPTAPRKVATLDNVAISIDVLIDLVNGAPCVVAAKVELDLTPEQYHALSDVDRAGCFRVVMYEMRRAA